MSCPYERVARGALSSHYGEAITVIDKFDSIINEEYEKLAAKYEESDYPEILHAVFDPVNIPVVDDLPEYCFDKETGRRKTWNRLFNDIRIDRSCVVDSAFANL
jgi:hypothetical protein